MANIVELNRVPTLLKTTTEPTTADLSHWDECYDGLLHVVENAVFSAAEKYLETYQGGQWAIHVYADINGRTFIVWEPPIDSDIMILSTESGHGDIELSGQAVGFALTGIAVNHLSWLLYDKGLMPQAEAMVDQWESIRISYPDLLDENDAGAVWRFLD